MLFQLHGGMVSNMHVLATPFSTVHNTKYFTVKNGVFQKSSWGCLNVHSSTTPNRVFLKPAFEGVAEHPQNTLTSSSESLKGMLCKYLHSINSQLYVICHCE